MFNFVLVFSYWDSLVPDWNSWFFTRWVAGLTCTITICNKITVRTSQLLISCEAVLCNWLVQTQSSSILPKRAANYHSLEKGRWCRDFIKVNDAVYLVIFFNEGLWSINFFVVLSAWLIILIWLTKMQAIITTRAGWCRDLLKLNNIWSFFQWRTITLLEMF